MQQHADAALTGRQRLRVSTADRAHDDAFAAAAALVLAGAREVPPFGRIAAAADGPATTRSAVALAAAALALGDERLAGATIAAAAEAHAALGLLPADFSAPAAHAVDGTRGRLAAGPSDTACIVTLAARHHATTGDRGFALECWPFLIRLIASQPPTDSVDAGAVRAGLRAIGESIGQPIPAALSADPVAIGASAGHNRQRRDSRPADPIRAAATLCAADGAAFAAAAFVLRTTEDVLGYAPDAGRHRLELRLAPPADWTTIHADAFVVGDGSVTFEYRRTTDRATLHFAQHDGSIPVRLVLNARVPVTGTLRFLVDGEAAELDPRVETGHTIVPVQFPLDEDRTLEIRWA